MVKSTVGFVVRTLSNIPFHRTFGVMFSSAGKTIISNDGATIVNLLDIVHPAAHTLVDIAKSQDAEVTPTLCACYLNCGVLLGLCSLGFPAKYWLKVTFFWNFPFKQSLCQ